MLCCQTRLQAHAEMSSPFPDEPPSSIQASARLRVAVGRACEVSLNYTCDAAPSNSSGMSPSF